MNRTLKRTFAIVALVTALGAISAPLAQARFQVDPPNGSAAATSQSTTASSAGGPSFDWGDAAIGATAMLLIVSFASGAVLIARHYRNQAAIG